MRLRLATALTLAAAAFAGPLVAPAAPALAAANGVVPTNEIGYDVSFPQCAKDGGTWTDRIGQALPAEPAFAVVGVNEGLGNTNNPCFAAQLQWALGATAVTSQPRVGLYVNTQNPGKQASWWPSGDATQAGSPVRNPFGRCTGGAGAACAWVYGYSMAEADVTPAVRKVAVPRAYTWWLDVETSNDWSTDRTANRAVLEGMVAAFGSAGAPVGIYSTHSQWEEIVGSVPASSPLTGLPSWLSAAVTQRGAEENCTHAPLTAGRVVLAQWTDGALDYNIACRQLSAAPRPTVSGRAVIGSRLTARAGAWAPGGVALAYRWLRNGRAIAGATSAGYVLRPSDAGTRISVRVIGTKPAYSRDVRTSLALSVPRRLATAGPTIAGTPSKGATLTADAGTWSPAPVKLTYRWLRDGRVIAGGSGRRHVVVRADLGHRLTVTVRGTRAGYAPASRTSGAVGIARGAAAVRPATVRPPGVRPAPTLPPTPPATVPASAPSSGVPTLPPTPPAAPAPIAAPASASGDPGVRWFRPGVG